MSAPEPRYPDDTVCATCGSEVNDDGEQDRDGFGIWQPKRCQECGATGEVEHQFAGGTRYHGDVTTRRAYDRREAEEFHGR